MPRDGAGHAANDQLEAIENKNRSEKFQEKQQIKDF